MATESQGITIQVTGLVELQRTLRELGPEYVAELKKTNAEVATFVAKAAIAYLSRTGNRLARSVSRLKQRGGPIRGAGQQRKAVIKIGGARPDKYQTVHGLEWGALRRGYREETVFNEWVGNQYTGSTSPGYFVGRTIDDDEAAWADLYLEKVDELVDRLWPPTGLRPITVGDRSGVRRLTGG